MRDVKTCFTRAQEVQRSAQKQMKQEQSQHFDCMGNDGYQSNGQRYNGYKHADYKRRNRFKQDCNSKYQEQAWGTFGYENEYDQHRSIEYEERLHRTNGWNTGYKQNYGYVTDQWQIINNNRYHLDQRINEAYLENQPVVNREEEEDEFEQFLNGPFAKR